ncbi:integrin-binding sialoprotein [Pelodytes ibericus]
MNHEINRFQRRWKGSDSDEKVPARNKHSYYFYRNLMFQAPNKPFISNVKGSDSSEENGESSDEEDSSEVVQNGNKAGSEEADAEGAEEKGAGEEADSEGADADNENGGTSAPEVEETTSYQNETEIENGEQSNTTENTLGTEPTQSATIESATREVEAHVLKTTGNPVSTVDETLGNEEGSNGGIVSTAASDTTSNYENGHEHENEVDYRTRGDTYARYEDEYRYRNHIYDGYDREYDYYQS